jgi:hypothetical protein
MHLEDENSLHARKQHQQQKRRFQQAKGQADVQPAAKFTAGSHRREVGSQ